MTCLSKFQGCGKATCSTCQTKVFCSDIYVLGSNGDLCRDCFENVCKSKGKRFWRIHQQTAHNFYNGNGSEYGSARKIDTNKLDYDTSQSTEEQLQMIRLMYKSGKIDYNDMLVKSQFITKMNSTRASKNDFYKCLDSVKIDKYTRGQVDYSITDIGHISDPKTLYKLNTLMNSDVTTF
jgi:hypothetical protein